MLKAIIIIIALIFILSWLSRPRIVINVGGMGNNRRNPEEDRKRWEQEYKRKEGQIKVDYIPEKPKNKPGNLSNSGDYVDYEEVS